MWSSRTGHPKPASRNRFRRTAGAVGTTLALAASALAPAAAPAWAEVDPTADPGLSGTLTYAGYVAANGNTGVVNLATADPGPDSPAKVPGQNPIVVSLGDSYISGVAGRWAGNALWPQTADSTDALGPTGYADFNGAEAVPGCLRSRSAEINFGSPDGANVTSVNLACGGAETRTRPDRPVFKPGVDDYRATLSNGSLALGQTALLHNLAASNPGRVSMVVLSIGGNDFGFGSVLQDCLLRFGAGAVPCSKVPANQEAFDPNGQRVLALRVAIRDAIVRVQTAMIDAGYTPNQWSLLVQDYPSPVATRDTIRYPQTYARQTIGGCGFYDKDLDWANGTVLQVINDTVFAAAEDAEDAGYSNIEVMDLTSSLVGHRLCERNVNLVGWLYWSPIQGNVYSPVRVWTQPNAVDLSEWVAQIRVATLADDTLPWKAGESLHPNYWAQRATSVCVEQAWNDASPRSGVCQYAGAGLRDDKRPRMQLTTVESGTDGPGNADAPRPVRGLRVAAKANGVAVATWRKPGTGPRPDGYEFRTRRSAPGRDGGWSAWSAWFDNGVSRTATLSVLRPGWTYRIAVRAHNDGDAGKPVTATFTVPARR